ncbi:hypothetical protein LSM04_006411 [Trypanosoma melophagium]|uniref:uncharacterized protein n=1 Tax=Trypanosoma melophagium TaxID=715481 RepID=UPI00351A7622|nr:hypothetical protein LSM04_006411 [Trypanosoma melophagium]
MTTTTTTTTNHNTSVLSTTETNGDVPITRLPPYFPTSSKECTKQTELFFSCFEQHAVMENPYDTVSAKRALLFCQPELREYMACMEKHRATENNGKPWWKFW